MQYERVKKRIAREMRYHICFSGSQPHYLLVLPELLPFYSYSSSVLSEALKEANGVPTEGNLRSRDSDDSVKSLFHLTTIPFLNLRQDSNNRSSAWVLKPKPNLLSGFGHRALFFRLLLISGQATLGSGLLQTFNI